jgi:hypothetical protein
MAFSDEGEASSPITIRTGEPSFHAVPRQTLTEHGASFKTFCETLPNRNLASAERP